MKTTRWLRSRALRFRGSAIFVVLMLNACASAPPARESCARIQLDPAPSWTGSASWNGRGDHLLVVDPEIRGLLAFDLEGRLADRVEHSALADLDYSMPIRVEASGRSARIGDRSGVMKLRRWGVSGVLENTFEREELFLGDWTLVNDHEVVGYADIASGEDSWSQGFVRIGKTGVEQILDLPLDAKKEYLEYHDYFQRPYVARIDDAVYILRYTEPVVVSRIEGDEIREIWRADSAEEGSFVAMLPWQNALYLLQRVKVEVEAEDEPTAPTPLTSSPGLKLESLAPAKFKSLWFLARLDPLEGRITWRRPLPTKNRPVLAPGPHAWALIDGTSIPQLREEPKPTWLTLMPTERFGPEAPARFCEPAAPFGPG